MKCPICQSLDLKEIELSGYKYIKCESCHTLRLKIFPKTVYRKSYYNGRFSLANLLFKPLERLFYLIRNSYSGLEKKELWIDVGAGEGNFLKSVRAENKIGVEISEDGRKLMQKAGIITYTQEEFLRKKDLTADVISFWHVLEHIEKPWVYLEAAGKNLVKNGKIIIGIPNNQSFEFKLFKKYWFHLVPKYHYWQFTASSMSLLLKRLGFKIIKIDYWSPEHHLAGILQSFINATDNSDNVLHKLVKRGTEKVDLSFEDGLIILFWLTLGLPIVFLFWMVQSLTKRSGTVVIVASPSKNV